MVEQDILPQPPQHVHADSPLFNYTSGRWLWNEQAQLRARYRWFDVDALRRTACRALGAKQCVTLEKIGEGNCNKAYRLTMDDGQRVIAKLPHPNAGPSNLVTASEVATMEFARTVLGLPVPRVHAWSATDRHPVGSEFIIMDEAQGSQLHSAWPGLSLRDKRNVISSIVEVEARLLSVSFASIGSIYFNDSSIPDCVPFAGTIESKDTSDPVKARFCVGPIVRGEFWEEERKNMSRYHGPWGSSTQYLESIALREIDWISNDAKHKQKQLPPTHSPKQYVSEYEMSPEAHVASLRKFLSAIPHIVPTDQDLLRPRLWHPDFHAGNIFVDDQGQVSSIIDWQGTWTTPAFLGVTPSALLDYGVDMLMKLPDNFKALDETVKDRLRYQVSQSILIHAYETLVAKRNPLMHKMMRHPHGQTLKQIEAFSGSTWDNCLYPLDECLIRMQQEWEYFDSNEPCPYQYTAEAIREHRAQAESFNNERSFWEDLRDIVTDEGYASNETFSKAVKVFKNLRETGLTRLTEKEKTEFERKTSWIADLKA